MSDTRLIVADSIASISRRDWEALTANDVYGQYGWLQAIEVGMRDARRPQYFLLYRNDQLIAAAVGYRFARSRDLNRLDDLLFGRMASLAARLHLTPNDSLYFGPLIGHGRHVFWDRDCSPDDAAERIRLLLEKIAARKESAGVTFAFGRIPVEETRLLTALRGLGYVETRSWPISYLNVQWTNFEDYVSSLSRRGENLSNKIRREVATPEKKGVRVVRLSDFGSEAVAIHRLFDDTHRKNSSGAIEFGPELIEALATYHPAGCVMTVARADGKPGLLGCALLLVADGVASGALVGIAAQALNRVAFTYFNLCFYAPIQFCLENDIRRIYFGGGRRHMKRRRGCNDMDVSLFMRPAGPVGRLFWRAWFVMHRYWVRRKTLRDAN